MKKLKVLQVTHDLKVGGLQKLVVDIATNIDRTRFDIAVCCLREPGPFAAKLAENNIPVYEINQVVDGKTNYFSFLDVYKVLSRQNIDIIHTHNTNPFIDGGIASILARTPVRIHTDHAREYPDKIRYLIAEKMLSILYDRVVAVSEQTRENLIHFGKIAPSKIMTIQNGVAINQNVASKRREYNKGKSEKIILGTIGRLCTAKGYEYLIRSAAMLRKYSNNFELQIIGNGELMPDLVKLAESQNITSHIKFVGEQSDVSPFYEQFDIFVISSISEGLPLVLLEAMAYGVPIVSTNVGGIPAVIKDGVSAITVRPYDEIVLAEKIWFMINNPDKRAKYASAALDDFNEHFGIENMMSKYENLYVDCYKRHV